MGDDNIDSMGGHAVVVDDELREVEDLGGAIEGAEDAWLVAASGDGVASPDDGVAAVADC